VLRFLFLFAASAAALFAQSSVWKITRAGNTIYLGGTVHLLRSEDFPLPPEFEAAFSASRKLYFETDVSQLQSGAVQEAVLQHGVFTDGRSLDRILSPAAWKTVQHYCTKAGLPVDYVKQMKPWLFAITMALVELQKLGVSQEGVDLHYHRRASEAGKATGELEPFDRHLQFLVNFGAGHESEMIEKSMEDVAELPRVFEQTIAAWRVGDLAQIDRLLLRDIRQKFPAIHKALLTDRNAAWAPKIDALLRTPEVELVLVGAGHLPGRDGLLALLKARGCAVEQFTTPAGNAPKAKAKAGNAR
jgi:uncharacterized protein YbaP (TraB family)